MEWSKIIEEVTKVVAMILVFGFGFYVKDKVEKRKKENKADLGTYDIDDLVNPILQLIQERFHAYRVQYWEGRNGSYTLSGMSVRKLSLESEYNAPMANDVKHEMQDVPLSSFKRNVETLRETEEESSYISYESQYFDNLSALHSAYNLRTLVLYKVNVRKKWVGLLIIGFEEEEKQVTLKDKSWLLLQAGRIGTIIEENV